MKYIVTYVENYKANVIPYSQLFHSNALYVQINYSINSFTTSMKYFGP